MENPEKTTTKFNFNPEWLASFFVPGGHARPGYEVTAKDFALMLAAYGKHNILCVDPSSLDGKEKAWVNILNADVVRYAGHDRYKAIQPMCERLEESFCVMDAYPNERDLELKLDAEDVQASHPRSRKNPRMRPLYVDVSTISRFRSAFSVSVYLRLLAWTFYPSLASYQIGEEEGMHVITVGRDDVAKLLGFYMPVMKPGAFNRSFKMVEDDLARAGFVVSARWISDGRRLSVFKLRWRYDRFLTKPQPAPSNEKPRRLGRMTKIYTMPAVAQAPAVSPDISASNGPAKDDDGDTVAVLDRPTVAAAPTAEPPHAPAPPVWTSPEGETLDERHARWQSAGDLVFSRGEKMFPDPTAHPDLDLYARLQMRLRYPEDLANYSDDKWFDRLESEGVKVPRFTTPTPGAYMGFPEADELLESARKRYADDEEEDDDEQSDD